jgi:putative transposase
MKNTVFQQLLKPLTNKLMARCVQKFNSDYHYEYFKTREHLESMVYVQINMIKSLRDLVVAINGQKLGIKTPVKKSTLSDANTNRKAECFFWLLSQLMSLLPRKHYKDMNKVARLLDSSPIQLRGPGYEWAKQHATHHITGLKLHAEYDLALSSPTRIVTSQANCNDVLMGQQWPIQAGAIYVFDKGYYDYNWWWSIDQKRAFFVTRLKKNAVLKIKSKNKATGGSILKDNQFHFTNKTPRGGKKNLYGGLLRRIIVKRKGKAPLILVTNMHNAPAEEVAALYKARWGIELFFKWIKQNLKIKKFIGKSMNAVRIQLATALIAYVLLMLLKYTSKLDLSLKLLLVWVRCNLQTKVKNYLKYKPPHYQFILTDERAVQL